MANFESVDFFNRDALQSEDRISISAQILGDREFWLTNLSDRFFMTFNFTFFFFVFMIIYLVFFIVFVFPNLFRTGEFRADHSSITLFLFSLFVLAVFVKDINLFLPERGAKVAEIQNSILLSDCAAYEKFLLQWRRALCFFSLTLSSFLWPFMLIALAGFFLVSLYSRKKDGRKEKIVCIDGLKII